MWRITGEFSGSVKGFKKIEIIDCKLTWKILFVWVFLMDIHPFRKMKKAAEHCLLPLLSFLSAKSHDILM